MEMHVIDRKRRPRGQKKPTKSVKSLIDLHFMLKVLFKSLVDCAKDGGFVVETQKGERILYKPSILLISGDTSGHNNLTCHHNSSGQNNPNVLLSNKCKCKFAQLSSVPTTCEFISIFDIRRSLVDEEYARSISQHPVASAINDLPLADFFRGAAGMTPPEILHVFYLGVYVMITQIVHDLIGKKDKNAKWKDLIDQCHQLISIEMMRQSDRGFHRCSIRFGFMDQTRVTGVERAANVMVFAILLYTKQGQELMHPFLHRAGISIQLMRKALKLLLSYEQWYMALSNDRLDVITAQPAVNELMKMLQKAFPREATKKSVSVEVYNSPVRKKRNSGNVKKKISQPRVKKVTVIEGSNGYNNVKSHMAMTLPHWMQEFGSGTNQSGQPGEEHHKHMFKVHALRTNRQPGSFTVQVCQGYSDMVLQRSVYNWVKLKCPDRSDVRVPSNEFKMLGMYTIDISGLQQTSTTASVTTLWHARPKRILSNQYPNLKDRVVRRLNSK